MPDPTRMDGKEEYDVEEDDLKFMHEYDALNICICAHPVHAISFI